jgi:hypothetical protein
MLYASAFLLCSITIRTGMDKTADIHQNVRSPRSFTTSQYLFQCMFFLPQRYFISSHPLAPGPAH